MLVSLLETDYAITKSPVSVCVDSFFFFFFFKERVFHIISVLLLNRSCVVPLL